MLPLHPSPFSCRLLWELLRQLATSPMHVCIWKPRHLKQSYKDAVFNHTGIVCLIWNCICMGIYVEEYCACSPLFFCRFHCSPKSCLQGTETRQEAVWSFGKLLGRSQRRVAEFLLSLNPLFSSRETPWKINSRTWLCLFENTLSER